MLRYRLAMDSPATLRNYLAWASLIAVTLCSSVQAQLRIVSYNTATGSSGGQNTARPELATVLEAIGLESVGGIAKPIDVLLLQEQFSPETSAQSIVDMLNGIYGEGVYEKGDLRGRTSDPGGEGGAPGLVYNTTTVELIDEIRFGTVSGSAQARSVLRYQLRPVGYDSSADFYAYNSHYKASTGSTNEARRLVEATAIRDNSDALGDGVHAIYAGDFNMRSSFEAAYQKLLSTGNGQGFDPINTPGNWHNNSSIRHTHTQAPASSQQYPGQVTGGVDDRFDFQLVTGEFLDTEGLDYISGSYRAFGNNGTHFCCNSSITTGTGASPAILDALQKATDHLPVVADYQLPAVMSVALDTVPARVIRDSMVNFNATITNAANVVDVTGADELDYALTTMGNASGSGSGTVAALANGDVVGVAFDTSTTGAFSGAVDVTTSSQSAANASFNQSIDIDVLDNANASFSDLGDIDSLIIDFGQVAQGGSMATQDFQIFNLEQTTAFTAALDLDSFEAADDVAAFSTNLASFTGLAAGAASSLFTATFDTTIGLGVFSDTYTLTLSDEDILGAASQTITLELLGEVVAATLAGDFNGDELVDAADYTLWRDNLGAMDDLPINDAGDGVPGITVADFDVWKANYTGDVAQVLEDHGVVPEPSALAIIGFLLVAGWFIRPDARPLSKI